MNLNKLKPAWKQLVFLNSMQAMDHKEILSIIEQADRQAIRRWPLLMTNVIIFIVLTFCCQGG